MNNIKLQHPVALRRSDFAFRFFCSLCATSANILSLFSLHCHYMFWSNWPSSDVQVVVTKETAAHCNVVVVKHIMAIKRKRQENINRRCIYTAKKKKKKRNRRAVLCMVNPRTFKWLKKNPR
jgi:hypothetical protein